MRERRSCQSHHYALLRIRALIRLGIPSVCILEELALSLLGRQLIPNNLQKRRIIADHAERYNLDTFVETGTWLGDTTYYMRKHCGTICTIELSPDLASMASRRFSKRPNIRVLSGDSSKLLPEVLKSVNHPCLFWLDAHYSGGTTAKGDVETPILQELAVILADPTARHVVLIDDARLFVGKNDYPTIEELRAWVHRLRPGTSVSVSEDIICLLPGQ